MNKVLYKNAGKDSLKYGMIMIHGRGAGANDILGLTEELDSNSFLFAAPEAPGHTWYPYSFLAPIESNEPYLSESLKIIGDVLGEFTTKGIPYENIILLGFSQGACLVLEYALRNPRIYRGIAALSGGIISTGLSNSDSSSLKGMPVFLGCSENDPHIPSERVLLSSEIFKKMGAQVTSRLYPGSFHGIIQDEINEIKRIMSFTDT